ncbi:MAG TPA: PD-(D/E)XK nuclease family protein [Solirubrobacteraceae bacterium]|nr:PD-(D/E)XK nuclease family protein [Solirubrobacteraceae bacterium]
MPIHLVTGPANSGKASVLLGALRSAAQRGAEPLLVVPTRADQLRYRRELAESAVTVGVHVERFDGLLARASERAGVGPATIGALARELLIARLTGATPALAAALGEVVAELEVQRVSPARLRGALRAWAQSGRRLAQLELFGERLDAGAAGGTGGGGLAGERSTLEAVCDAYERYRAALQAMRARDRELQACATLDALRRRPAAWGETPLFVYGFDDLTELQFDAIETLGAVVDAPLTVSLAYEPGRVVFAGRAASFQRLAPIAAQHTQLPARADYYESPAREALHHLERSLFAHGSERVAPGDAVCLLAAASPRAELELVAAEVRSLIDDGVDAGQIAIVHRQPQAIAALLGEMLDAHGVAHAIDVRVAFADTAIGRGLLGLLRCALGVAQLGDLLAWLRCPGVLEQPQLADRLEARALRAGALSAERARALWELERWPLEQIDRVAAAAGESPTVLAELLAVELERLFAAPRRGEARVLAEHELQEAGALSAGRRALAALGELSRLSPAGADAAEALQVLERLSFFSEPPPGPGRVRVLDPLGLRARRVRMLFVCGMQEGVFPAASPSTLVADEERRALARTSGLSLRGATDALAAERYLLYALASRPERRLTFSWHTAGEDGGPAVRSLFIDDVCDAFQDTLRFRAPAAELVDSGPVGAREQAIRPLADERVLAAMRERRLWSASALELWNACPVRWFVERLLGGEELGPDAEPLARGSLAHAALKLTLERLRERTGSARLTAASLPAARKLLAAALDELGDEHPLSVAPERLPGARARLRHELERYLECAAEQSSPLEPRHLELEFGFEDSQAPTPPLDLGEGVLVRGRIDRIDVGSDGQAVVYDYKGRAAPPAARWLRDGSWQVALYMRAARDLLGMRPIGGFYQPLAGRELAPRGALNADADLELDCVRTDRLDHESFELLIEDCVSAARDAALQARAGTLQPRPATCAYGGGCAHPTICRCGP